MWKKYWHWNMSYSDYLETIFNLWIAQRITVIFDALHYIFVSFSSGGATSCGPRFNWAVLICDLITLTFWPLNGVTGHPCIGLPSYQFSVSYTPFHCWFRVRHGTDRWTDNGHCAPPYGSRGIKIIQFCKTDQSRIWPDSGYPAGSG